MKSIVFETGVSDNKRSEHFQVVDELFSQVNYLTKTRFKDAYGAAKFLLVGFDQLPEEDQKKIMRCVAWNLGDSPITIGSFFIVFNYFLALCEVSEQGKSREEFVAALGSEARIEEARATRAFKGSFGQ